MHKDGRYHNSHRAKCVGKNVKKYTMHILISVRMIMAMVVAVCVSMVKCHDTDQVDKKTSNADNQQFTDTVHLAARGESLNCLVYNFNTDDPLGLSIFRSCKGYYRRSLT